jgi:hypothetical protein
MLFRQLTDEQKAALPQLKTFIDGLDSSLKQADASIGNFQRNVGNYPGLMAQMGQSAASMAASVNPAFGSVTQVVMGMGEQFGLTSGAIGALGGVIGVAAAGFKVFQDAMELTQTVGDAVEIKVAGWQATYDKFIRMVASADFSNFIQGLSDAKQAGEELAATLDELFERNNALRLEEAKAKIVQQENLMIMRDQTRSLQERIAAGKAYEESIMAIAEQRKKIAQDEANARLADYVTQAGMSGADAEFFIRDYNIYRKYLNEYQKLKSEYDTEQSFIQIRNQWGGIVTEQELEKVKQMKQAYEEYFNGLTKDQQRFITVSEKYNNVNNELTSALVSAWEAVDLSIAGALTSSQRAAATVSGLAKRVQIDTSKVGLLKKQKSNTKIKADGLFEEFEREADAEWEGFAEVQAGNMVKAAEIAIDDFIEEMEAEPAIVLDRIKQSPFAKALGVTDEQLTSIKSQALQAAQQIYGSIQQAAQQASQRRLDNELKAVETEAEQEKAILKANLDSGVINEKQYEKKIAEIDKNAEAKREEMQKEAFEREKRWNIATALMNMALAITNIWATNKGGAAARIAETVIATASGLAQIAAISAQKYARGGELHGASHAQGGIKGNIQGHNIELEGDEVVINKRSSRKYRSLLSYINSDNGWGVDFAGVRGRGGYHPQLKYARGGVLGSYNFSPASVPQASLLQKQMERQVEHTESLIAATNRRIDRLQVQVNISDIEGASNTKRVHINRAKL